MLISILHSFDDVVFCTVIEDVLKFVQMFLVELIWNENYRISSSL